MFPSALVVPFFLIYYLFHFHFYLYCKSYLYSFYISLVPSASVATDPVLVTQAIRRHEGVALLLCSNSVGACRDDVSVEGLIARIRHCWFHIA